MLTSSACPLRTEIFWNSLSPAERDDGQRAIGPLLMLGLQDNLVQLEDSDVAERILTAARCDDANFRRPWSQAGAILTRLGTAISQETKPTMQGDFFTEGQAAWLGRRNTYYGSGEAFERQQRISAFNTLPFMMGFITALNRRHPDGNFDAPILQKEPGRVVEQILQSDWFKQLVKTAAYVDSGFWAIPDGFDSIDAYPHVIDKAITINAEPFKWGPAWKPIQSAADGSYVFTDSAKRYLTVRITMKNLLTKAPGVIFPDNARHNQKPTAGCPVGVRSLEVPVAERAYTPAQLNRLTTEGILQEQGNDFVISYDPYQAVCEGAALINRRAIHQFNA